MKIVSRKKQEPQVKNPASEIHDLMFGAEKQLSEAEQKQIEQVFENIRRQLGIKQP